MRGARDAIDWYGSVFGAVVEGEPYENDDGSIGHVALRIADGVIYLADEAPAYGAVAPTGPGAAVSLMLPVPDADATLADAVREGATPDDRGVYEAYGRATRGSSTRSATAGASAGPPRLTVVAHRPARGATSDSP